MSDETHFHLKECIKNPSLGFLDSENPKGIITISIAFLKNVLFGDTGHDRGIFIISLNFL